MRCIQLSLTQFRNYQHLDLALGDVVVVFGDNAQGKSNLVEAIRLLSTTRSFRATADREMLSWAVQESSTGFARVVGQVERRAGPTRIEIVIGPSDSAGAREIGRAVSRRYRANGVPRRAIDVIGLMTTVQFTPADMNLVLGPPTERRRFLDLAIAQIDPRHARALTRYARVLQQRNALLKQMRDGGGRGEHLDVWTEELATAGAFIVARRLDMARAIAPLVGRAHASLTGDAEALAVAYQGTVGGIDDASLDDISVVADAFRSALAVSRTREIGAGQTLVGPHRDDLRVQFDGHDLGAYGSRGQQRAGALALKIAEGDYVHAVTGEWPILLLDDVLSELDATRRQRVFAASREGQQVIVTTTDLASCDRAFLERAQTIEICRGTASIRGAGVRHAEVP